MLLCRCPRTVEYRDIRVQELEDQLVSLNNHTDLVTLICLGTKAVGESVLLDVSGHPKEISLRKLIDEKNKIGWSFFLMGFWLQGWTEIQETHLYN